MSSWGLLDNATIAGTVTVYTTNVNVQGSSTYFLQNVSSGDYISVGGQKYQVANVTSNTLMSFSSVAAANASSATAYVQTGPKSLSNINGNYTGRLGREGNLQTIQTVYGVTLNEMYSNSITSITISNVGAGYRAFANVNAAVANTWANVYTVGASQPTSNGNVTLSFTANTLTSVTISNPGAGYTEAAKSNTYIYIATTGTSQPTINAIANVNFSSASTSQPNAHHTGWVSYITYTDAFGNVREKQETLVALSKNFTGTSAGDASDDTIYGD